MPPLYLKENHVQQQPIQQPFPQQQPPPIQQPIPELIPQQQQIEQPQQQPIPQQIEQPQQIPEKSNQSKFEEENNDSIDKDDCIVCYSKKKEVVLIPCGHICLCFECSKEIQSKKPTCPYCRANFIQIVKIYHV